MTLAPPPRQPPHQPPGADTYREAAGSRSRSLWPFVLITLGVVFLLGNLVPEHGRGGLILVGLGVAFLTGRLATGRYGYAVPAGLLIALGTYISLPFVGTPRPVSGGGWFFVLLGLGFALVYVFGLRPWAVWPLFPATVLVGLGVVLFGLDALAPLASLSWIVSLWPGALVLVGLWLLFRDQLPDAARRPIATLGGLGLLAYGLLAAASSVAAGGALARTGLAPAFGASPFADTLTLVAPIGAGQTLTVANTNGSTTIRAGADPSTVHVVANRHFSAAGQGPIVTLDPTGDGALLQASPSAGGLFAGPNWVDYAIEVPAGTAVRAQASSGSIDIEGLTGPVTASTNSGGITLSNLTGSVDAQATSGSIVLTNVAGGASASTSSGQVRGSQLQHVRSVQTNSGSVRLDGVFTEASAIRTSSGSVDVTLSPDSAVRLEVQTGSGSISTGRVPLASVSQQRNSLSGTLGSPASGAVLHIETSSGSIRLNR